MSLPSPWNAIHFRRRLDFLISPDMVFPLKTSQFNKLDKRGMNEQNPKQSGNRNH
jgi:hypothetical protein